MSLELEVKLPEGVGRVESGTVQFNKDWPGTFIRGDDCCYYNLELLQIIEEMEAKKDRSFSSMLRLNALKALQELLSGCILNQSPSPSSNKQSSLPQKPISDSAESVQDSLTLHIL